MKQSKNNHNRELNTKELEDLIVTSDALGLINLLEKYPTDMSLRDYAYQIAIAHDKTHIQEQLLEHKVTQLVARSCHRSLTCLLSKHHPHRYLVNIAFKLACTLDKKDIVQILLGLRNRIVANKMTAKETAGKSSHLYASDECLLHGLLTAFNGNKKEIVNILISHIIYILIDKYDSIDDSIDEEEDEDDSITYLIFVDSKNHCKFKVYIAFLEKICISALKYKCVNLFHSICKLIDKVAKTLSENLCYEILITLRELYTDNQKMLEDVMNTYRSFSEYALHYCITDPDHEHFRQVLSIVSKNAGNIDINMIITLNKLFDYADNHLEICTIFVSIFPKLFWQIDTFFGRICSVSKAVSDSAVICEGCTIEHTQNFKYVTHDDESTVIGCVDCMTDVLTKLHQCCICLEDTTILHFMTVTPCKHNQFCEK